MTIADKSKALIKYGLSFLKSDWDFKDYPVRVRHQKSERLDEDSRIALIPWVAQIINWPLVGHGNTKEEALKNLKDNFEGHINLLFFLKPAISNTFRISLR